MVHRYKEPNKNLWNGLGGKLEPDEKANSSVKREIIEEANIDLEKAKNLFFAGIVTWSNIDNLDQKVGMYAFVAEMNSDYQIQDEKIDTEEGLLEWKDENWVCNTENKEVVSNIPHFLAPMIRKEPPSEYYFIYDGDDFVKMTKLELPSDISIE